MPKKKSEELEIVDAELLDELTPDINRPPVAATADEIHAEAELRKYQLQAYIDVAETLTPEARYDAVTALTGEIQTRFQLVILNRLRWLESPDVSPELRREALETIIRLQDQSNNIKKTDIALYDALGLNERKGVAGGKDVPKLLIPSRTAAEFEREFGEAVAEFGPPKGAA